MIDQLLIECIEQNASDLHLSVDEVPVFRIRGDLVKTDSAVATREQIDEVLRTLLSKSRMEKFNREQSVDFGYSISSGERFRGNAYYERGNPALALRYLSQKTKSFSALGLPDSLAELARMRNGLVLVTGPTGSGKTTTLNAMLDLINRERPTHVITIEDPIEFLHSNQQAIFHQREVHTDVPDFASAVRSAMREDPDVILVGEMRDVETMRASLTAAETGHLVFSTMHTGDAIGVLDRVVGAFPGNEQDAIRSQLAMSLRGVVAQHLLPSIPPHEGRVPVVEILRSTSAVAHLIRTGRPQQLVSVLQSSRADGMQNIEVSLSDAVLRGRVDREFARWYARDPQLFDELTSRRDRSGVGRSSNG